GVVVADAVRHLDLQAERLGRGACAVDALLVPAVVVRLLGRRDRDLRDLRAATRAAEGGGGDDRRRDRREERDAQDPSHSRSPLRVGAVPRKSVLPSSPSTRSTSSGSRPLTRTFAISTDGWWKGASEPYSTRSGPTRSTASRIFVCMGIPEVSR